MAQNKGDPLTEAPNRVILTLTLLSLGLLWTLDFSAIQPNRIVSGTGYGLYSALGPLLSLAVSLILLLLMALAVRSWRFRYRVLQVMLIASLALLPMLLVVFTERHLSADQPYARVTLSGGFWCAAFLLSLMLVEVFGRLKTVRGMGPLAVLLIALLWWWVLASDGLQNLSLVLEFQSQSAQFKQALWRHLTLSAGAVAFSAVIAFALALKMIRHSGWQRPVLGAVSFLQTVPSLAVFGLLIAPLSALSSAFPVLQSLGIRGIGWAPALLALIAYSLLPMVRNTFVALTDVPADLLNAGRGMGMTERQLFLQVTLPLALPVILEGVRVTLIQAIGLTAVAALIGAGGFGTFIFQGLGQAAMDLVLLGALPTVALALLADAALSWLASAVQPKVTSA